MTEDKKEKGYKVVDKRFSDQKDTTQSKSTMLGEKPTFEQLPHKERFIFLVTLLAQNAMIYLGEEDNSANKKKMLNLDEAKNIISLIETIQEKTINNLDSEENQYVQSILHTLRLRFTEKVKIV